MSRPDVLPYSSDLARTGVIVILLFLIDGIKIDQVRLALSDYWHFFFGLFGVFIAVCNRIERQTQRTSGGKDNANLNGLPSS
jgi:hypothetical protein